ncbi:MAG: hypothetical protein CM15mP4_2720 [Candidatus Neomarinimicrobiota bacterium]|nr:MAG: hypothetical protein CM15mP4_2720 [Candidatus Neomarinimicrobiota bacterium]
MTYFSIPPANFPLILALWLVVNIIAFKPEPHILLIVKLGTLFDIPEKIVAWRAGACPNPADRTYPLSPRQ